AEVYLYPIMALFFVGFSAVALGLAAYLWRQARRESVSLAWPLAAAFVALGAFMQAAKAYLPARWWFVDDALTGIVVIGLFIMVWRLFHGERRELHLALSAERKRARQMGLLAHIARRLAGLNDPQALLRETVRRLHEDFGFEHVSLLLVEGDELVLRAVAGRFAQTLALGQRVALGQGVVGWVGQTGETYVTNNAAEDGHFGSLPDAHAEAEVAVPLRFAKNVVGVLNVESERKGAFDFVDVTTLESLADLVVAGLQSSQLFAELLTRERQAQALRRVGAAVTASLNLSVVLDTICAETCMAFEADSVVIWLLEDETLRAAAVRGLNAEAMLGHRIPLANTGYVAVRAVLERRPIFVNDISHHSDEAPFHFKHITNAQALLATPIVNEAQPIGALSILDVHHPQRFSASDVAAAQLLGAQLAIAIQNARLFDETGRWAEEQRLLLNAARDFTAGLSEEGVLRAIARHMVSALRMVSCSVSRWEPEHDQVVTLLHHTVDDEASHDEPGTVYALAGYPATRRVLMDRRPVIVSLDDPEADPMECALLRQFGYGSLLMLPLVSGEQVFGLLELARQPGAAPISNAEVQLAQGLAAQAGVALENAYLHAEVRALALTDGLTGLANRRAFDRSLEIEVTRALRYAQPLSLIILDLDSFKQYNDAYGHPAGDERLRAIAQLLRANVREPDFAARYGGEEFAVLLPHTGKPGALALAERIRAAAEATVQPLAGGPVPGYTLSLGVATFPEDASTLPTLLVAADDAELAAKRAGKNRVCAAPPLTLALEPEVTPPN
ncbi:MAG: GAF domain-containing protein, partial [Anaerolineales bacterium]